MTNTVAVAHVVRVFDAIRAEMAIQDDALGRALDRIYRSSRHVAKLLPAGHHVEFADDPDAGDKAYCTCGRSSGWYQTSADALAALKYSHVLDGLLAATVGLTCAPVGTDVDSLRRRLRRREMAKADDSLKVISSIRRAAVTAGTWPAASTAAWQEHARDAHRRHHQGDRLDPIDLHALDLFPETP